MAKVNEELRALIVKILSDPPVLIQLDDDADERLAQDAYLKAVRILELAEKKASPTK